MELRMRKSVGGRNQEFSTKRLRKSKGIPDRDA